MLQNSKMHMINEITCGADNVTLKVFGYLHFEQQEQHLINGDAFVQLHHFVERCVQN